MIETKTLNHFDSIAGTWAQKEWVTSSNLNGAIDRFVRASERKIGLQKKRYKTSVYFGIGTGVLFDYFKRYNIAGVDEAAEMLRQCPEGIVQILSDVRQLPFLPDNQFHLTFSRNLLKHCTDPLEAVKSMYDKARPGCLSITAESSALTMADTAIPTELVRMTDPSHPRFLNVEETVDLYKQAGFSQVDYKIVPHRSAWLGKWIQAEQASKDVRDEVIKMYRKAPDSFIKNHQVVIENNEITSTVPWLLVRAIK